MRLVGLYRVKPFERYEVAAIKWTLVALVHSPIELHDDLKDIVMLQLIQAEMLSYT